MRKVIGRICKINLSYKTYQMIVPIEHAASEHIIALRLGLVPMPQDQLKKALDFEFARLKAEEDADEAMKKMAAEHQEHQEHQEQKEQPNG